MKTMTKEDLYFLHDIVKNHPYWNLGTQYGLTSLQDLCEQLHKLQIELFRFLGVRKDYEWLKNPQIVLVDYCVHDVNHEMWYIKNGSVVFETDVVTGKPSTSTPTGLYRILEKKQDKILRGERKPDGSYGYETPVSYWMRVTWSGIGFHDATWQSAFGGNRYVNGYGSHGCINMPLQKAKELYNMISIETRVIIHK